jgi:hypothetical protein
MNRFVDCLCENLKSLNAKERDHLVRYAYQGRPGEEGEESNRPWLSKDMIEDLKKSVPELGQAARCVFAGMDFHLDWLHGALFLACKSIKLEKNGDPPQAPCLPVLIGSYEEDKSLRSVTGGQEDVDLVAVFVDGERTIVLFMEAKGVGSIDTLQLARKLIRLARIIEESGAKQRSDVVFVPFLIAPHGPNKRLPKTLWGYGRRAKGVGSNALGAEGLQGFGHESPIRFLALSGLPNKKVTREKEDKSAAGEYTHWTIKNR